MVSPASPRSFFSFSGSVERTSFEIAFSFGAAASGSFSALTVAASFSSRTRWTFRADLGSARRPWP